MAEGALPQGWSISSERCLFVLGVAVSLPSFKEEKETFVADLILLSHHIHAVYK